VQCAVLAPELPVGIEVVGVRVRVPVIDVSKDSGPYKRAAFRYQVVRDDPEHEFEHSPERQKEFHWNLLSG